LSRFGCDDVWHVDYGVLKSVGSSLTMTVLLRGVLALWACCCRTFRVSFCCCGREQNGIRDSDCPHCRLCCRVCRSCCNILCETTEGLQIATRRGP